MNPPRGRLGWYAAGVGLLLASVVVIVVTSLDLDVQTGPLWISIALSIAAIAAAIAAIVPPRRR